MEKFLIRRYRGLETGRMAYIQLAFIDFSR